jgi:hypothetical protein
VKWQVTFQLCAAKRIDSPIAVPGKRPSSFWPTQISFCPGAGFVPSVTATLARTVQACSLTPRTTTLASFVVSAIRPSGTTMYDSALTSWRPSAPRPMCGAAEMMLADARSMLLESSESAARRRTSTVSSEPVRVSAAAKPLASASIPTNTATTSPMPSAVSAVDSGRPIMLRKL